MPDFSRLAGLLQNRKRFDENLFLTGVVPHLPDQSSVRVSDCCRSRNTNRAVKLVCRGEYNGCKSGLLQQSGSQSHGLAAKWSRRCEQDRIDLLLFHLFGHRRDGRIQKIDALPLEPVI